MQITLISLSKFISSPTNANQMLSIYFPYITKLSALHLGRRNLDALFLINVFVNRITCLSVLSTVCIRVPPKITRDHSIFTAACCDKAGPSARFVTAANTVGTKVNVIKQHDFSLTLR